MTPEEARKVLGLDGEASREQVVSAYRRASKEAYPIADDGDRERWERIHEARNLLLDEPGSEMVPLRAALELVKAQEKSILRSEERRERVAASQAAQHSVVRRHTSKLNERRRRAWMAAVIAAGAAGLTALLRAVVLTDTTVEGNYAYAAVIVGLSVVAAMAGFLGLVLRTRAEQLEQTVEDITTQLSQRAEFLRVLTEIQRFSEGPPWPANALQSEIRVWAEAIDANEPSSLASAVLEIGSTDFGQLLISKGLELEILEEKTTRTDDGVLVSFDIAPAYS